MGILCSNYWHTPGRSMYTEEDKNMVKSDYAKYKKPPPALNNVVGTPKS